jgi:CBS domain-containing protein
MPKLTIDPAADADAALGTIGRAIEAAPSVADLAPAIEGIHQFAINLLTQGVGSDRITRFISALNDAVTRRIIEIDCQLHDLSGIAWTWLAFGSEGREEQTLSTDQDNGIVFQCEAGAEAEAAEPSAKARLLAFAQAVNADLDRCGYPLCEGNIMAGNPEWCLTLREWKLRFAGWIYKPEPLALLNASIFFDFRIIYGKALLADELHRYLFSISQSNTAFQRMLAANALYVAPPLGIFRDFVTQSEQGGAPFIDLKKRGARLFVDAARVLALAHGIESANTGQRLRRAAVIDNKADGNEAMVEAFNFIQLLRLRQQYLKTGQSREGGNRLPPAQLDQADRRRLKEAFRQARRLQQRLDLRYQLAMM